LLGMKRNREERLKSGGTHHFLVSPHNSEKMEERRLLTLLFHYLIFRAPARTGRVAQKKLINLIDIKFN
jgi:hypothetical protein